LKKQAFGKEIKMLARKGFTDVELSAEELKLIEKGKEKLIATRTKTLKQEAAI